MKNTMSVEYEKQDSIPSLYNYGCMNNHMENLAAEFFVLHFLERRLFACMSVSAFFMCFGSPGFCMASHVYSSDISPERFLSHQLDIGFPFVHCTHRKMQNNQTCNFIRCAHFQNFLYIMTHEGRNHFMSTE